MNRWRRLNQPLTIAHRGHSTTMPEQTMTAFQAAIAAGVDAIEADVHSTLDDHLVMIHDEWVDRTTDGKGLVSAMTLQQVRALDAGSWFGSEFRGERVPLLDELLDLAAQSGTVLCLEAKGADHSATVSTALAIADSLAGRKALGVHVMLSGDRLALVAARRRHPELTLAPDRVPERGWSPAASVVQEALRIGAPIILIHPHDLTQATVDALHDADLAIWSLPTTDAADIPAVLGLGVDGLMGDDAPTLVRAVHGRAGGGVR